MQKELRQYLALELILFVITQREAILKLYLDTLGRYIRTIQWQLFLPPGIEDVIKRKDIAVGKDSWFSSVSWSNWPFTPCWTQSVGQWGVECSLVYPCLQNSMSFPGNVRAHIDGVTQTKYEHEVVEQEWDLNHVLGIKLDVVACFPAWYSKRAHGAGITMVRSCMVDSRIKMRSVLL